MSSTVVFVGGSVDGTEVTVADEPPPPRVFAAEPLGISALMRTDPLEPSFTTLVYEPIRDALGHPSRDDRGRWRYQYRPEGRRP